MAIRVQRITISEKFWAWVNKDGPTLIDTPCWLWNGDLDKDGYGRFWDGKKQVRAYLWAWTEANGRRPRFSYELDHLCRNRQCVRPNHLEEVTHKENTLRSEGVTAQNARKTECDKGHPLPPDRVCRICAAERSKKSRQGKKRQPA